MKTAAALAALVGTAAAFAPASNSAVRQQTSLSAATGFEEVGGQPWDPLGLANLEDAADTFPNMFPRTQFLQEAEIKHGRMAMLAWTGVWATTPTGLGLGMHFPGAPVEPDWTKALGVWASEDPSGFAAILTLIAIAEQRPQDLDALAEIPGVGPKKLAEHGDAVIGLVLERA